MIRQKPGQVQVTVEHVRVSEEREQTVARKKQNMAWNKGGLIYRSEVENGA